MKGLLPAVRFKTMLRLIRRCKAVPAPLPPETPQGGIPMPEWTASWQVFAILSAVFAALTAIFAKIGVESVNSDFATFFRTCVVVVVLGGILMATRQMQSPLTIAPRSLFFLVMSGLATGASWLCYFRALKLGTASQVAPVDKLSVVLVALFGVLFLGEHLSPQSWIGVGLVGAGAVIMALG
jgi:transporter family protein